jgi:hypothetical protein
MPTLEGRSVVAAMCVGQLGGLLPHVVVPSILAAFLISEWHLSGQVRAFIHIALALPLNLSLPRAEPLKVSVHEEASPAQPAQQSETVAMLLVAYVFAATG